MEDLLRGLAPQVLGAVVRRFGHFDTAEDAVQEALIAATTRWPVDGVPDNPKAWLITVAARRLTDLLRAEQARQRRETEYRPLPTGTAVDHDDTLVLLFMCCHPSLSPASQIALTLRAVGGLTTGEIARAFLVPEATMTRRVTRAKQSIRDSGVPFGMPEDGLGSVLHVLYLIFNEGYVSTTGPDLQRPDLATEAIRLTRIVHRLAPDNAEVTGLVALMLLTDARRPARTAPDGRIIPMDEQDRTLWNTGMITEGVTLVSAALSRGPAGPYQIQAAIAALHDEAPTAAETDWPQIVALYEVLGDNNPIVALNHAVAVAMATGPDKGLELLVPLEKALQGNHRWHAVRAHLLEMRGDREAARASYLDAARLTMSLPQQRYLRKRANMCPPTDS